MKTLFKTNKAYRNLIHKRCELIDKIVFCFEHMDFISMDNAQTELETINKTIKEMEKIA